MTAGSGSAGTAGEGFRAAEGDRDTGPEPTRWTTTHGDVVTVWEAQPGDWRWHAVARNGEVGDHGEGHTRKAGAIEAAERHHPRVDGEATS